MTRPLHVVITVNAAWNVVNFRMPLVNALLAAGHTITVLAPDDQATQHLINAGCQCVNLELDKKGLNPLKDGALTITFWKKFKQLKPDVVLSFTIKNNLFGALAAKQLGIPFVPNVTGLGTAFLSGGLLLGIAKALYKIAFRSLPAIFFQNADDQTLFIRSSLVSRSQTRLLPGSGIDTIKFAPIPYPNDGQGIVFLFIGRIIRDKGIVEFVEAARLLQKTNRTDLRFQVLGAVGFANRSSISVDQVDQWKSEGVIEYLGVVDDVRGPIGSAHCIVLPSYREGAPRTLIEGAALARPAIATDVPGCNAVVDGGETGLLCESHSAASLAQAMVEFAALDHTSRKSMGKRARSRIEQNYSADRITAAYKSIIAELVQ